MGGLWGGVHVAVIDEFFSVIMVYCVLGGIEIAF